MNKEKFVEDFENAIDVLTPGTLTIETNFKEIPEWDSMFALSVIAMVDSEYEVQISASELRSSQTVLDIYSIVSQKKAE